MAPFFNWMDIVKDMDPGPTLPAGMSRRGVVMGDVMLALHEALPTLKGTPHRHPSAQITYMLKGKMRLSIDGEEQVLSPGEFAYVPPNVLHGIESLDEYVLALDIFSPPRADINERLRDLEKKAPGKGAV
jgi:mannose-6-phosphate isomerase-like protein (cupin superfamily)